MTALRCTQKLLSSMRHPQEVRRQTLGLRPVFAQVKPSALLLDALVGNQDRHHENWGLIISTGRGLTLPHIRSRIQSWPERDG